MTIIYLINHSTNKLSTRFVFVIFCVFQADLRHLVAKHFHHQDTKTQREISANSLALCFWAFVANFSVYPFNFFKGCKPFLFFVRLIKAEIIDKHRFSRDESVLNICPI